jgi:MraZ protein
VITGQYHVALDDKGRLLLPSKVRSHFEDGLMFLTQGIDKCLWIYAPDDWQRICDSLMEATNVFQAQARMIKRRIIAPSQETDFDKSGRITVSPALREYAGLHKECVILGIRSYLEIWDEATYREYWNVNEPEFQVAVEQIGKTLTP